MRPALDANTSDLPLKRDMIKRTISLMTGCCTIPSSSGSDSSYKMLGSAVSTEVILLVAMASLRWWPCQVAL